MVQITCFLAVVLSLVATVEAAPGCVCGLNDCYCGSARAGWALCPPPLGDATLLLAPCVGCRFKPNASLTVNTWTNANGEWEEHPEALSTFPPGLRQPALRAHARPRAPATAVCPLPRC
jgi:hypothetical protein